MRQSLTKVVVDASTGTEHRLSVLLDQHGCSIEVDGEHRLVLDFDENRLRVYAVNENGDIVDGPLAAIQLGEKE